ncbi:hypothetical protein B484DRAFT_406754 [Ochromonadaceae sp. CCMP2298]|nr:hypothetical protein B484DRAFT_406754 [Ochromonadaceae sp. CCMP2298]
MMHAEINEKPPSATASKATTKKKDKRNAKAAADANTAADTEFTGPDEDVVAKMLEEVQEAARVNGFVIKEVMDGEVTVTKKDETDQTD